MASRHERRKRAYAKKCQCEATRREAFIAAKRADAVKRNLAADNREVATLTNHLGQSRLVRTNAYSRITDSFVRMVQGGGLIECLNLDRPEGDTDRMVAALKAKTKARA
jgi:hypothetical protein